MATISEITSAEIAAKYALTDNTFLKAADVADYKATEIEIGDSKQVDAFYPQIKIMNWENEVNFSARLVQTEAEQLVTTEGKDIVWAGENLSSKFYETENGYEFLVCLPKPLQAPRIQFTLQSKGLEFIKQPAFTDQFREGQQDPKNEKRTIGKVTESEVFDADGNLIAYRPPNIVNSYMIRSSEPLINYVGGKEYRTGKVGCIYRPQIKDSSGLTRWAELDIADGLMTISWDDTDLVYPIEIDPEFGRHSTPASSYNISGSNYCFANRASATRRTAATGDTVTDLNVYQQSDASENCYVAIYNYSTGAKLMETTYAGTTTAGWKSQTGLTQALANGVTYFLAYSILGGTVWYDTGSTGDSQYFSVANLPDPWSGGSDDTWLHGLYATYTAGGGTPILEQEGFRFRNDDGSESGATWAESQDAGVTAQVNTNMRLRMLINATGDPTSGGYELQFKKSTDSIYKRVQVEQ